VGSAETTVLLEDARLRVSAAPLPGVLVLEPKVFRDDRGFFLETFREELLRKAGVTAEFVQDNHSRSARHAIRGLHFQIPPGQPKLVRCARGSVFDAVVDLRESSPTFRRSWSCTLSDHDHRQLYIPPGFAHGFCVTSDEADFVYRCGSYYDPEAERGIAWDSAGIDWPTDAPILSDRDRNNPDLSDYSGPWFP